MRYEVTLIATFTVEADNDDAALSKAEDCIDWVECYDEKGNKPEICHVWTVEEMTKEKEEQAEKLLEDLINYNKENNNV